MSYKEGNNGILATEHCEVVFHGIIHLSADPNPGRHTAWEIIPKSDPAPEYADSIFYTAQTFTVIKYVEEKFSKM